MQVKLIIRSRGGWLRRILTVSQTAAVGEKSLKKEEVEVGCRNYQAIPFDIPWNTS